MLQNQRLHAGGSHGIVGLQKLGRRRSQRQIHCVAPTSLHPGLHPISTHYCRPGKLVRIFFQSRRPWKGAQIYLSALWGPNQQEKNQTGKEPNIPRQPAFLLQALPSHCSPLPATLFCLHIYLLSPRVTSISLRQGIKISLSGQCLTRAAVAKREKPFSNTAPSFLCANTALN